MMDIIGEAVRTALVNESTVTTLVSTRVYNTSVPSGAGLPYIVMFYNGGGDTNDTPTQNIDVTLTVKCVSDQASEATTGAGAIRTALHESDLGTVDSWNFYRCQCAEVIFYDEHVDRTQFYHGGYLVRIRAHKEG